MCRRKRGRTEKVIHLCLLPIHGKARVENQHLLPPLPQRKRSFLPLPHDYEVETVPDLAKCQTHQTVNGETHAIRKVERQEYLTLCP